MENGPLSARRGIRLNTMVDVGFGDSTFHKGECMRRGWCPNRPLDLTLARTKGSLAVALGPVVTVYGLDLVEASPAIYVIHPVCVARE